ncbi:hypothetical protein V6N13_125795 [Hibiscus sabdariffa]
MEWSNQGVKVINTFLCHYLQGMGKDAQSTLDLWFEHLPCVSALASLGSSCNDRLERDISKPGNSILCSATLENCGDIMLDFICRLIHLFK